MAFGASICIPYTEGVPFGKVAAFGYFAGPNTWRNVRAPSIDPYTELLALGAGRDDAEGDAPPSIHFPRGGSIRLRLAVDSGERTLSVRCRQTQDPPVALPYIRILRNEEVGIMADLAQTAPAGEGWKTIGPLAFTVAEVGGIVLELVAPQEGYHGECWFDSVTLT